MQTNHSHEVAFYGAIHQTDFARLLSIAFVAVPARCFLNEKHLR